MDLEGLTTLGDEEDPGHYTNLPFNQSGSWVSATSLSTIQTDLTGISGPSHEQHEETSAASNDPLVTHTATNRQDQSFGESLFSNTAGLATVQVLQAGVLPFDTAQLPQIPFADPRITMALRADTVSNVIFQEPHLDLRESPRPSHAYQPPFGQVDSPVPGPYPLTLEEFDDVQPALRLPTDAPWSGQDTETSMRNTLPPYAGEIHGPCGTTYDPGTSALYHGHIRAWRLSHVQLPQEWPGYESFHDGYYSNSGMLTPWHQETYPNPSPRLVSAGMLRWVRKDEIC